MLMVQRTYAPDVPIESIVNACAALGTDQVETIMRQRSVWPTRPGDSEAIGALHVAADRAQLAGDPLGEWISLGLAHWMDRRTVGLDPLIAWLRERADTRGEREVARGSGR